PPIGVIAAPDTPWQALATIAQELAGTPCRSVAFLLSAKSTLQEPSPTSDASKRSKGPVFERCKQVPDATTSAAGDRGGDAPSEKGELFAKVLPAGLRACGCAVDLEAVKFLLWGEMDRFSGPPAYAARIDLARPKQSGAQTLALPADAAWS